MDAQGRQMSLLLVNVVHHMIPMVSFARFSVLSSLSQFTVYVVRPASYGCIVILILFSSRELCEVLLSWIPLSTSTLPLPLYRSSTLSQRCPGCDRASRLVFPVT